MFNASGAPRPSSRTIFILSLSALFLAIEFFDELHYAIDNAALPAIRESLGLSYGQIGLLLGLPHLFSTLFEPAILLLGDTRFRKGLIVAGGLGVAAALMLIATSQSFTVLLAAQIINFPASGAFVALSQASLMELQPGQQLRMMARWTAAGSLGNLIGPLLLAGGFSLAAGWRWAFYALAGLAFLLTVNVAVQRLPPLSGETGPSPIRPGQLLMNLREILLNRQVLGWLALMEVADLLLDIFSEYLPLYLTDVAGLSPAQASFGLTVLMASGLVTDLMLIPLLERFPGHRLVRLGSVAALCVYPAWLLVPSPLAKLALLPVLRLVTIGWYPVIQGEAFTAAPGRSGAVLAAGALGGILGGSLTWMLGQVASWFGLPVSMWLLLVGPLTLALFMPTPAHSELVHEN